ncbi:MAG: DedA family protein [Muribaculaceae bacterium]|nr:DedA family protein [Bacteroides sp.]MDE6804410.1 DedA family protein [Muribaculaceae bacterium]MDE7188528.1 DedA family protein [Muribaculaceae bacterium]
MLLSIFDASQFFQWFVENANYLFVFVFMVIESSFIPFPSEVVVPPAAYLACTNTGAGSDMNIIIVVLMATLGALVGAYINYYLALWIGRPVVYKFADSRFGHALMINREKVVKAENYFDKHGAVSTFIGRLIPAIRQLISIPAGIARMNIWVFSLFTFLGALVWNSVLGGLGYWLSLHVSPDQLFEKVEEYNKYLTWCGYGIAVICVLFILWNAFKPKKKMNEV